MDRSAVALGRLEQKKSTAKVAGHVSTEERIAMLEQQLDDIMKMLMFIQIRLKANKEHTARKRGEPLPAPHGLNKDGIPNEIVCVGFTERSHFPVFMTVKPDHYQVGYDRYPSLSAAAEAVSGARRSGWAFWRLPDGRTLKEAFRK